MAQNSDHHTKNRETSSKVEGEEMNSKAKYYLLTQENGQEHLLS